MGKAWIYAAVFLPGMAFADSWTPMDGSEIAEALAGVTLRYADASQTFYADGQTVYTAGRPSFGSWRVTGDQYCSVWPPSDRWSCYDMARMGDALRFVASDGSMTDGVIK